MKTVSNSVKLYLPTLWKISLPLIIEQVFITLMGLVNTAMVSNVGNYALSAASMVDNISNIIIAVFAALTTGGAIIVAQRSGAGDKHGAASAGGQSIVMVTILSMFLFAVFLIFREPIIYGLFGAADKDVIEAGSRYFFIVNFSFPVLAILQTIFAALRGSGDTGSPMVITLGMNVVNIFFGWLLIFGVDLPFLRLPGYGIAGAALALLISRSLGLIAAGYFIFRRSKAIRLYSLSFFKLKKPMVKSVLGLGVPTGAESTLFNVGKLITQLFIVGMGTAALAANGVASNLSGLINVPGNAFATGAMIVIGRMAGQGRHSEIRDAALFSVGLGSVVMAVLCVAVFPATNFLGSLYNLHGDALGFFRQLMISNLFVTPLVWSLSFVTPAALRAVGDVKYTMVVAIVSMWVFRIAVGYVLGVRLNLGPLGVWIGMYVDWVVRGALFLARFIKGNWKKAAMDLASMDEF